MSTIGICGLLTFIFSIVDQAPWGIGVGLAERVDLSGVTAWVPSPRISTSDQGGPMRIGALERPARNRLYVLPIRLVA